MNKYIFGMVLLVLSFVGLQLNYGKAEAVSVRGFFKKDGTYVSPYTRTRPNNNRFDNYSTKGNINPYTGKKGYTDPYKDYSSSFSQRYKLPSYKSYTSPSYDGYKSPTYKKYDSYSSPSYNRYKTPSYYR